MVTVSLSLSEDGSGTPWSRSHATAAFPALTLGCCLSYYFLSKDRLSCEDDPIIEADAGILLRLGCTRLKADLIRGENYLMLAVTKKHQNKCVQ